MYLRYNDSDFSNNLRSAMPNAAEEGNHQTLLHAEHMQHYHANTHRIHTPHCPPSLRRCAVPSASGRRAHKILLIKTARACTRHHTRAIAFCALKAHIIPPAPGGGAPSGGASGSIKDTSDTLGSPAIPRYRMNGIKPQ